MIELTTGVVFLMSSLYGAGHGEARLTAMAAAASDSVGDATTTETRSFTEQIEVNSVEAYLRKEFADTPLLVEIARCESNFHQFDKNGELIHGIVNKADVGVMQINKMYHAETALKLKIDLNTLEGNAAFGKYLYSKYGSSPWSASKPCWGTSELAKK